MTNELCSDPQCPCARSQHYHEEDEVRLTNVRFEQPIGDIAIAYRVRYPADGDTEGAFFV